LERKIIFPLPHPAPRIHFSAPINAFSESSDGQQQRSTPLLFGSAASMSISKGQPVIGAPMNRSALTLLLTMTDGKKISVFVGFGRGAETNASALVAPSAVLAGGAVERGLLSGWLFQQPLAPCE
jgi:hypothetical protein